MTSLGVVIRWAAHHSVLTDNDSIIIRTGKFTPVPDTVALIEKPPLPRDVLVLTDALWEAACRYGGID